MDILKSSQLLIFSHSTIFITFSYRSLAGFLFKLSSRRRKPEVALDFCVWPLCGLCMKVDLRQNVRLVVSLWRFVVSSFCSGVFIVSARRFLKSTRRITSSIFVGWSAVSFRRFIVSSCRFVVSLCRFVVSTRPLREAIIRRTLHEVFTWFHALIHDVFIRNLVCADWKGILLKCYLRHSIEFVLNRVNERFHGSENETVCLVSRYTLWQSFVYSACIFVTQTRSRPRCSYIRIFFF